MHKYKYNHDNTRQLYSSNNQNYILLLEISILIWRWDLFGP